MSRGGPARSGASGLAAVALCAACSLSSSPSAPAGSAEPVDAYRPHRAEYRAFQRRHPELIEPNYLPFMTHRTPDPAGGPDLLFFCRWDSERMPLRVFIEPFSIDALQDEFHPMSPERYVDAVARALETWEVNLEGHVSFRRVDDPDEADLRVRIRGEAGPEPEPGTVVMGAVSFRDACRVLGPHPDHGQDRLAVEFALPELRLFVADAHGLLTPEQFEGVALHELGHALGMRMHSPIPADLMFAAVRDRGLVVDLSGQDVNSFVTLYSLPNGTLYGRVESGPQAPRPAPGPPRLAMAPHVDTRLGFAVTPPAGWLRVETPHGFVAVDGTTWDYDASFQVIVAPYPTIEQYLGRYGPAHFRGRRLARHARIVVNGRPALQLAVEDRGGQLAEEYVLVETGDGRVVIVIADCPSDAIEVWRPWFQASLGTLEFLTARGWEGGEGLPDG